MAGAKTVLTGASVTAFIKAIENPRRRKEAEAVKRIMGRVTGHRPRMWGTSIVGYGQYHYKYASGREGDFFLTGFSPRKGTMTVYIIPGFKRYTDLLARLGPHKHTSSCLYLTSFEDVDLKVLEKLIAASVKDMRKKYPA